MAAKATNQKMKFGSIYLLGLNGIIGSGIFLLPGTIYGQVGSWSILLIFVAALASLLLALCYADLASRIDGDGGAWLYTFDTFGKFMGFQVGWFSWVQGIVTIAAEVAAAMSVLKVLLPVLKNPVVFRASSVGIILLLALINLAGPKMSKLSDNVATIVKSAVLLLFIVVCGFFIIQKHQFQFDFKQLNLGETNSAMNTVFYMFTGFAFLPVAAQSMENAKKSLPKALIATIATVAVIYSLIQLVTILVLQNKLIDNQSPLASALKLLTGNAGYVLIIIGMLISILGVALSVSYSTPFVASSLANEKHLLPKFLGKTAANGVPTTSIIITTIISCLLVLSGSYLFLVSCVVLISLFQYVMVALSTIKVDKEPAPSSFHLKMGNLVPILALILCVYLAFGISMQVWLFGLILIVIGIVFYYLDCVDQDEQKKMDKRAV